MRHPREGRLDRRDFLMRSAGAMAGLGSIGALLAACGGGASSSSAGPETTATSGAAATSAATSGAGNATTATVGGIALARPDSPVTLPIYDDNPAIASGLQPEQGPLRIYNWTDYIYKKIVKKFSDQYGVDVEISTFYTIDEATAKLASGETDYDVFFPTPDRIARLVAGKIIQPLNLDYIPNLAANIWPALQSPFYDVGSQYTVPYTIYTTGIAYRADKVTQPPGDLSNPYEIFWDSAYKGKVFLLDDSREAPAMVLLKDGITDVNTEDPALIDQAKKGLLDLISTSNVKVSVEDYTKIPEGTAWVHQGWSGDMIAAQWYLPKGTSTDVLGFWYPPQGGGVIGNDTISVLRSAKNPVLAHLFLNFMLDEKNAYDNFAEYNGYQPPLTSLNPDNLVADGVVPANVSTAVVRESDFKKGYELLELSPDGQVLWQNAWAEFKAGT